MTNCHVISLASAVERRAFMTEQFGKAGVAFEFFDAVDADTLDLDTTGYVPNMNLICTNRRSELDPSEVACFESHRRLWERCIQLDLDHIAIFEDDILLTADFQDVLWNIGRYASDYDVIKLDWVPHRLMLCDVRSIYENRKVGSVTSWLPSAGAYIVNNAGARKLLYESMRYCEVLDGFVFPRPVAGKWNNCCNQLQHKWCGCRTICARNTRKRSRAASGKARLIVPGIEIPPNANGAKP